MASITIRNLKDDVKKRLRVRAAENGRSMEEEVRAILQESVAGTRSFSEEPGKYDSPAGPRKGKRARGKPFESKPRQAVSDDNIFDSIRRKFEPFGGVELQLPKRTASRRFQKFK